MHKILIDNDEKDSQFLGAWSDSKPTSLCDPSVSYLH
jgi:hypothetical protein